ncbi:MAG: hypothetical protein D6788_11220 [Planctomycetota bacterium]|nr:MAG: hypothetical protein D6788_11220 [Planctomycetota bacterium]
MEINTMKKRTVKAIAFAMLAGTVCQFGCLGDNFFGWVLRNAALEAGFEFVLDNNSVFDLFPDGGTTTSNAG